MARLKLPFELEKPSSNEYVTQASEVGHEGYPMTDFIGSCVTNPEFLEVVTDKQGRILWAIQRNGNVFFGIGVPQQIVDYINKKLSELSLDEYGDIVSFLNGIEEGDSTLQQLLNLKANASDVYSKASSDSRYALKDNTDFVGKLSLDKEVNPQTGDVNEASVEHVNNPEYVAVWLDKDGKILFGVRKNSEFVFGCGIPQQIVDEINKVRDDIVNKVDKEEGKSLIDALVASSMSAIDNQEYMKVETDFDGKILGGRKKDGRRIENAGLRVRGVFELEGGTFSICQSPEWLYVLLDARGIIIEGIKRDGSTYSIYSNNSADDGIGLRLYNLETRVDAIEDSLIPSYNPAKWLALGDSITEGYYSYFTDEPNDVGAFSINASKTWVSKVAKITGKTVTNKGIGGSGYLCKGPSNNKMNAKELVDTLSLANYELITIAYGINDYKGGETLGTMSDIVGTDNSVIANMRYVIEKIQISNPLAKIVVIMPFNARGYSSDRLGDLSSNYAIGHAVNGKTLQNFYDAMVTVCEYYGIQYIDATHSTIIARYAMNKLLPDGVHPSENAHTIIAREFSQKILVY